MLDFHTQRRAAIGSQIRDLLNHRGALPPFKKGMVASLLAEAETLEDGVASEHEQRYAEAFSSHLRGEIKPLTAEQRRLIDERREKRDVRDLTTTGAGTGSATSAGAFVAVTFEDKVASATRFTGPMLDPSVVTLITTQTGANRAFPQDNDSTVSGLQCKEGIQVQDTDVANLTNTTIGAYKYSSSIVKASREMAEDVGFDLDSYLAERFGIRIGRIVNNHLTVGSGSGEPTGWVTATVNNGAVISASGSSSNDGGTGLVGSDDLASLENSLDASYRFNARWQMHPSTLSALRKLKDKQGRPVFDIKDDGRLWGYEILLNSAMDQLQASGNPSSPAITRNVIGLGNYKKYVVKKSALSYVTRLDERYSDYGLLAWIYLARYDGNVVDSGNPIWLLQTTY